MLQSASHTRVGVSLLVHQSSYIIWQHINALKLWYDYGTNILLQSGLDMRECHFFFSSYTLSIILNEDIGHHTFGNIGIGFLTLSNIYFPLGKLVLLQYQFVFLKICGNFMRA